MTAEAPAPHPRQGSAPHVAPLGIPLRFPTQVPRVDLLGRIRVLVRSSEALLVLVAVGLGVGAGALVTLMSAVSQAAHSRLYGIPLDQRLSAAFKVSPTSALLVPMSGGLILGAMEWWRRYTKGRVGVDPIEANALRGGRMSLRDSIVISAQTLISNGCGASVGLEAGYTQISAGLASRIGIILNLRRSDLRIVVGCGAAGAIAAAFGAPLTGAFYAFELVVGVYSVANVAAVTAAALAAVLTTQALGGAPYDIGAPQLMALHASHYALLAAMGLIIGGLGVAVMQATALIDRAFEWSRIPVIARPALGGLAVGLLSLITPQVLAAGHGAMKLDLPLALPMTALVALIGLKLAASLISLGSGFRGGLFFASLFVGALTGKVFGEAFQMYLPHLHMDPTACVLAGMGALAVAIVGGPLTMSFLVLETTRDFGVTGAALAANIATSLMVRETFGYSFSTWRLHLRGETIRSAADVGWIRSLTVGRMMRRDPPTVPASSSLAEFRRRFPLGSAHWVVVVDDADAYAGMVAVAEAHAPEKDAAVVRTVADLARFKDLALVPDANVKEAMAAFDKAEAEVLAVVDTLETKRVIGVLSEAHATRRYAEELDKASRGLVGET